MHSAVSIFPLRMNLLVKRHAAPLYRHTGAQQVPLLIGRYVRPIDHHQYLLNPGQPLVGHFLGERKFRIQPNVLFFTGAGNNGGGYYQGTWTPISLAVSGTIYQAQDFGHSVGQGSRPYDSTSIPPDEA